LREAVLQLNIPAVEPMTGSIPKLKTENAGRGRG